MIKNCTNQLLNNARDLQMKQLGDTHVFKSEIDGDGHSEIDIKIENIENVVNYHIENDNQLHKVVECGAEFRWKNVLVRHVRSKHRGVKYSCNQCEYQATQKGSIKIHKESKHEGLKYSCNQCNYQATQQGHLERHKLSKHEDVKYSCDHCVYQASYKTNLRKHKISQHNLLM